MLYVVDLTKMKEIIVGRSLESDIIVNELSVSRKHCKLMIDRVKKQVKLVDLSAKFGTVVKINK
jgi:pSer/pThr/pTyr-binding forkhead associated (FHA) protein